MHAKALSLFVLPCLLLAVGCGGDGKTEQVVTTVSGRVVAGPVKGAEVTILPLLNTGALGTALGAGTTDDQGYYSLSVSDHVGPAVILVRGGEYVDEATGNTIVADDLELASLVMLAEGDHTAQVTVATTIAARRAMLLATGPTIGATDAMENGVAMVEEYYGIEGILTVPPADLTAGAVTPGPAAEYGALNAGFSQLAAERGIHLWSLVSELSKDASDGTFDGHLYAGPLYVEGPTGDGDLLTDTGGAELQDAIGVFMGQPRNASGLGVADLAIDEEIGRHLVEDPDFSFFIYQPRIDVIDPPLGLVDQETAVTLHGQFPDLDNVSLVVTFGGVAAQIVKGDDEELQVIAPVAAAAGKVDVEVACSHTRVHGIAPQGFEYYVANLTPVIAGVTPDRGPAVGGTLLEVTGSNFDPTAIVEIGGTQAQTLARLGRTGLVAVVPPGTGTVDVTVRQADTVSAPYATTAGAFSYFGQGIGEEPAETELDGQWKAYAIAHQYPDSVMLVNGNLTFAGGTYSESGEMWVATPGDPEGTTIAVDQDGKARAFADGTLWLRDSTLDYANRAFLSPQRDVFILTNDANAGGPVWLGAGIRRASGMSNASFTGTWHLALFSHGYETDADERTISSAWGTVEFDGIGNGSAGLVTASCATTPEGEDRRDAISAGFTYAVAPDGTFTITITPPDEVTPVVFHGSVTQARDLAIAASAEGGQAQFLMMVPAAEGFGPPYVQGSWYGGGIAYEYLPGYLGHVFVGETVRIVNDGHGQGVGEVTTRATSDAEDDFGLETETHGGETLCEATGLLIGGPDDLSGFVSASRRFQIFLPANLEAY
ncbi:MAG: IPT/TIG domain-containing protein, partial [Planctomycetes bacterium]|nr:IPT/TIG domain-containing protein [Planctomycetota bacterium]